MVHGINNNNLESQLGIVIWIIGNYTSYSCCKLVHFLLENYYKYYNSIENFNKKFIVLRQKTDTTHVSSGCGLITWVCSDQDNLCSVWGWHHGTVTCVCNAQRRVLCNQHPSLLLWRQLQKFKLLQTLRAKVLVVRIFTLLFNTRYFAI